MDIIRSSLVKLPFSLFGTISSRGNLSAAQKVAAVVVAAGVAITIVARYLRRRRRVLPSNLNKKLTPNVRRSRGFRSPNGDLSLNGSPVVHRSHRQSSVFSTDRTSVASGSTITPAEISENAAPCNDLTPQQLGVMGMEALETAINYWEDALAAYPARTSPGSLAVTGTEDAEFSRELQKILDLAYSLQEESELLFLDQRSVLFRAETESSSVRRHRDFSYSEPKSCADSFVSAQGEVADLREFEEFADTFADISHLPLYQSALKHYEESNIPFRCFRTEMVRCGSDVEYLCKLHCVREAFQRVFSNSKNWQHFADSGRQVLTDLLLYAEKDPKDFLIAYEDMLHFLQDKKHWQDFEAEMLLRDVKAITFYDVVLDYILMDAFEDLEAPPSSFTAVVQNRWLSNGFKETALTTAVWSVLRAKRRNLKYQNGFMARFYSISEQMSPLMAWGFLGPDERLKEICGYFKCQVMGFLMDIFSFKKSRYTTVDELAEDILKHLETRLENIIQRLSEG